MKIPVRQLNTHLKSTLSPVYMVAGDEPLIVDEALDNVRTAARAQQFAERELHVVDRSFKWVELEAQSNNLSLFAARRVVELRLNSSKLGDAGGKAVRALVERDDPDRLLLIGIHARVDAAVGRLAWVKSIEKHGVRVDVWPVDRAELPRWIAERAKKYALQLDRDAIEVLAERAEGNLLAADQELVKLSLTNTGGRLDAKTVLDAVSNSARFDVFRLVDAVLAGQAERALRVLAGLRAEGAQATLVAWGLNREIATLAQISFALEAGIETATAFRQNGVWPRRQPLVNRALQRFTRPQLVALLRDAAVLDQCVKGIGDRAPWAAITDFVFAAVAAGPGLKKSA